MIHSLNKERKKKMRCDRKLRSVMRSKSSWVCRESGPRSIKLNKRSMSWRVVFSRLALGPLNMSSALETMKTLFHGWLTCMVKRKRKLSVLPWSISLTLSLDLILTKLNQMSEMVKTIFTKLSQEPETTHRKEPCSNQQSMKCSKAWTLSTILSSNMVSSLLGLLSD